MVPPSARHGRHRRRHLRHHRRRHRHPQRPIRWLHQLSDLLTQATFAQQLDRAEADVGVRQRRFRQRIATARRLLDPLPTGLRNPDLTQERFWRILRWSGVGMLLAAWLGS